MVKSATHPTVAAGLCDRLRADILHGRLRSGERLRGTDIARREGVSLTVVREALVALVGQGLVVNEPQAGFAVTPLSAEDLLDLTAARVAVEGLILRQAVRDGTIQWEAAAVAAHHVLASLPMLTSDSVLSRHWSEAHGAFHLALAAGCGNRTLLAVRQRLYDRSEVYRWWSAAPGARLGRDVACEHRELLEAAVARDADLLVERMTSHVETTTAILLADHRAEEADPAEGTAASTGGRRVRASR